MLAALTMVQHAFPQHLDRKQHRVGIRKPVSAGSEPWVWGRKQLTGGTGATS